MATEEGSLGHISPFFIVSDLPRAVAFYEEKLGFEVRFSAPAEAPFFAIVGRDSVHVYLKEISDTEDELRGFEVSDDDGYVLFFGRPRNP